VNADLAEPLAYGAVLGGPFALRLPWLRRSSSNRV
jgi:hypothetical protein